MSPALEWDCTEAGKRSKTNTVGEHFDGLTPVTATCCAPKVSSRGDCVGHRPLCWCTVELTVFSRHLAPTTQETRHTVRRCPQPVRPPCSRGPCCIGSSTCVPCDYLLEGWRYARGPRSPSPSCGSLASFNAAYSTTDGNASGVAVARTMFSYCTDTSLNQVCSWLPRLQ